MKVTITGNGDPAGTRIVTEEGHDLSNFCSGLTFTHKACELPMADIQMSFAVIDVVGIPARMIAPNGKAVRRIEYEDGTVEEFAPEPPLVAATPMGDGRTRKFRIKP